MRLGALPIVAFVLIMAGVLGFSGCTVTVQPTPESERPGRYQPPPPSRVQADISFFYDQLAPYGEWFQLQSYGWAWAPHDVPYGWRPYTHGRWVYTDFGLTWISDWEWGWAPFHYGRWFFEPYYGWVWIPGREWAPAWVAWQYGSGWVGWVPLPPGVQWHAGVNLSAYVKPYWWCFTEERYLFETNLRRNIALPARNVTFLNITRNVTNYTVIQNRMVNRSIDIGQIERAVKRTVPRYNIVDRETAPTARDRMRGNEIQMFRHQLAETPPTKTPPRMEPSQLAERPGQRPGAGVRPGEHPSRVEILKRLENDRRELNARQQEERSRLEEIHRGEIQRPPSWMSIREMRRQHEEEKRVLDEQQEQERRSLQQRFERQPR